MNKRLSALFLLGLVTVTGVGLYQNQSLDELTPQSPKSTPTAASSLRPETPTALSFLDDADLMREGS